LPVAHLLLATPHQGTEKVILIQEQLSKNRIIIDTDSHGQVMASVTSSTAERKSKTNFIMKNSKVYMRQNAFGDDVNVVVVMKAMGAESDQEVVSLVGSEEALANLLLPTLQVRGAFAWLTGPSGCWLHRLGQAAMLQ
jgi:DNA-directed RNA polymerase III subunit RPC2